MALATAIAADGNAFAQSGPRVAFALDPCVPVDSTETSRIAVMELRASAVAAGDAATTTVSFRCEGTRVWIRVEDAATRKTLERAVDLSEVARPGGSRLLALAASELVYASWAEIDEPPPSLPPADPPPPVAVVETVRAALEQHRVEIGTSAPTPRQTPAPVTPAATVIPATSNPPDVSLGFAGRAFPLALGGAVWAGVQGDVTVRTASRMIFAVQLALTGASVRGELGSIEAWLPEAALLGGASFGRTTISLETRVGLRAGVAVYHGVPASPLLSRGSDFAAGFLGPCAQLVARWRASSHVGASVSLEMGYAVLPSGVKTQVRDAQGFVRDAQPSMGLSGPWLGLAVGLSWSP